MLYSELFLIAIVTVHENCTFLTTVNLLYNDVLGKGLMCDNNITNSSRSPDLKGAGWYRFTGGAGTRMPEQSPGSYRCQTYCPGWVNGIHPATPGEEKQVQICFDCYGYGYTCYRSTYATIRNCGNYYLYNLREVPSCYSRYCGQVSGSLLPNGFN